MKCWNSPEEYNQSILDRAIKSGERKILRKQFKQRDDVLWIDKNLYNLLSQSELYIPCDNPSAGLAGFYCIQDDNSCRYMIRVEDLQCKGDNSMAQVKPTYDNVDGFAAKAKKLLDKYPDFFGDVDISRIKCLAINNKTRSEKKKLWEMRAIPDFALPDCPYSYYAILYLNDWLEMPEKIKNRLVATLLYAVLEEECKVKPFDLRDYGSIVRTLGTDYLEEEEGLDPLEDEVKWVE